MAENEALPPAEVSTKNPDSSIGTQNAAPEAKNAATETQKTQIETEKTSIESPADYISHTMDRLINWGRVINGKDIVAKPPRSATQRLTETTLKVLAGYAVERNPATKDRNQELINLSTFALKTASGEIKQHVQNIFEKIFAPKSTSAETLRQITQIFQDQINNWWPSYVGRPEIDKREKYDGTKDEQLIQLDNPFRDPVIQREGNYTVGLGFPLEGNRKKSNFWDMAISTAFYDLREKIYQRRVDYETNNVSIAPLPRRPETGYTIIFQYDPDDESKLIKLNVSLDLVMSNNFSTFDSHVRLLLKKALSFDPERTIAGQLNAFPARRLTNISSTEYEKAKESGYFDQLYHTEKVQLDRIDLDNPFAADLRICHAKTGNDSRLETVQSKYQYDPMGVRIPTTYVFGYSGQQLLTAHVRSCHPLPDGRETNNEVKRVIKKSYEYAAAPDIADLPNAKQPEEKRLPETIFDPKRTTEFMSLSPENNTSSNDVVVVTLGGELHSRETGFRVETNPVELLYQETDKNRKDNLHNYYQKEFGISLSPAVVLNFALMKALDLQHTHFLDRNDNKLAPIICGYSPLFDTIHEQSQRGSLTELDCQRVISVLQLFSSERADFRDTPERKGRADAEVMSVTTGILKDTASELAKYMSPVEDELLTNSVLTSMMLEPNSEDDDEISMREFTTAIAANCAEKGAIGVCQTRKKDGLRISYRAGTRNLVEEKFGPGKIGATAFRDALRTALIDILIMFADVRNYLKRRPAQLQPVA